MKDNEKNSILSHLSNWVVRDSEIDAPKVNVGLNVAVATNSFLTISGQASVDVISDLSLSITDSKNEPVYFEQIKTDQYGNFKFTFDFNGNVKGKYTVTINAGQEPMTKDFDF